MRPKRSNSIPSSSFSHKAVTLGPRVGWGMIQVGPTWGLASDEALPSLSSRPRRGLSPPGSSRSCGGVRCCRLTPDLGRPTASAPGHSRAFPAGRGPSSAGVSRSSLCPHLSGVGRLEVGAEMGGVPWKRVELAALVVYALGFYLVVIRKSLRLSHGTAAAAAALTPPRSLLLSQRLPLVIQLLRGWCRLLRAALRTPRGITCGASECAWRLASLC